MKRDFLPWAWLAAVAFFLIHSVVEAATAGVESSRVRGLLLGSMIGDAVGGPMEFQPRETWSKLPNPPKLWRPGETLTPQAIEGLRARLVLRPYSVLRPLPEPYAHWTTNAPAGSITDDSRHKLILLHALRAALQEKAWPVTAERLASAYLSWTNSPCIAQSRAASALCHEWLHEYWLGARWVLGHRDPALALPTERLWNALPTCAGQMALTPLAAVFAGRPEAAYIATWNMAWLDNGIAKDMIASIVAGMAGALTEPLGGPSEPKWRRVWETMRRTDPWKFRDVPWSTRATAYWLDFALKAAERAKREPAILFAEFDKTFEHTVKWEAQLCLAVSIACIALCPEDPLAAMQLSIEWGHDTDSYAQLTGAFVGALLGPEIFPQTIRDTVETRVKEEYQESMDEMTGLLLRAAKVSKD